MLGTKSIETIYFGGIVYENIHIQGSPVEADKISFINHEEGRIRPVKIIPDSLPEYEGWAYDFFIKDHLGNIRAVLTDEHKEQKYFARFETNREAIEPLLFSNINQSKYPVSAAISLYPLFPPDPTTNPNEFTSRLNGSGRRIGASKVLKVMSGDKIELGVKYWFPQTNSGNNHPNDIPENVLQSLVNLLANGASGVSGGKIDPIELSGGTHGSILLPGLNEFLHHQPEENPYEQLPPRAYLNWILFDEQFNNSSGCSGFEQVGYYSNELRTLAADFTKPKNGYLFVYLSNETTGKDLFFDNLVIQHTNGPLLEETHYYPFGLTMAGISSKSAGTIENKYKYNGKELQSKEFSDGSGLEEYDYGARHYNVQIGRWSVIDRLSDFAPELTPYRYCANNPIIFNDPTGMWEFEVIKDKEGNQSLSLKKTSEKDNWKSFKKESGLTNGELKKAFGKDFEKSLDGVKFGGEGIASANIGGKLGETLKGVEQGLNEFNKGLNELESKGEGAANNCWGTCISLSKNGKIDPNGLIGAGFLFDSELKSNFDNVYSPKFGDVIRYSDGNDANNTATHGSVFLLRNDKGAQIFTKNGLSNSDLYQVMYENEMLKTYNGTNGFANYGGAKGMTRTETTTTQILGSEPTTSSTTVTDRPYYRPKN